MCPVCLATTAIIVGSTAGSGGLTALAAGLFIKRKALPIGPPTPTKPTRTKEDHHDDIDSGSNQDESGLPR
jgi:hypothetical protein